MRKAVVLATILLVMTPPLSADHRHIIANDKTDFSALKTFSIGAGRATTTRQELNNRLVLDKVQHAIRTRLTTRGLTETQANADVVVAFAVGEDKPHGPSVIFNQGVLLIEMRTRHNNELAWQAVYTDDVDSPAKVAQRLPDHVKKLLSEYPPRKKR